MLQILFRSKVVLCVTPVVWCNYFGKGHNISDFMFDTLCEVWREWSARFCAKYITFWLILTMSYVIIFSVHNVYVRQNLSWCYFSLCCVCIVRFILMFFHILEWKFISVGNKSNWMVRNGSYTFDMWPQFWRHYQRSSIQGHWANQWRRLHDSNWKIQVRNFMFVIKV